MTIIDGIILAGGLSRRFGSSKAAALYHGRPLIRHVADRLSPQVSRLAVAGHKTGVDADHLDDGPHAGAGPLAGIIAGLKWASAAGTSHVLSAPCDLPMFPANLVAILRKGLAVAARDDVPVVIRINGHTENACALWPVARLALIEQLLADENLRALHKVLGRLNAFEVEVNDADLDGSFRNVNSVQDLHALNAGSTA